MNPRALGLAGLATSVLVVACGASSANADSARNPFTRAAGNEATGSAGAWKAYRGLFPSYRPGARLAVLFTVHNATRQPVQLLDANVQLPARGALRLLGVRLSLAPPPPSGDILVTGLRAPYGHLAPPTPVLIPPHRNGWIQLNFSERYCLEGQPTQQTYNRHADLRYRTGRHTATTTLDLRGDQITLTAPLCSER